MSNIPCYSCGKYRDSNEKWTMCRSCGHMVCEACIVDDDLCEECFDDDGLCYAEDEEPQTSN